jgi:tetratricopeptide (TPR) repeat protein
MIQPLRATKEIWSFNWFDLNVPIQFGSLVMLPTCLYVVHRYSAMLIGHEFVRETDQRRAELLLHRLFQEKGVPDELQIPDFEEWDESIWQSLSREYHCEINLVDTEQEESLEAEEEDPIEVQISGLITSSAQNLLLTQGPGFLAQGLVRAVKHVRSAEKKRALLMKALELVEDLPEALVELADLELQEGNIDSAAEKFSTAADVAAPFHQPGQSSCYVRAQHGSILTAWQKGDLPQAIAIGEKTIFENPTDHSGIRFLLPLLQLSTGQLESARDFFDWYAQRFVDDLEDPGFYFGWGLALFDSDEEKRSAFRYRRGMVQNLYLAPLLLDLPEPSPEIWQHNERGDLQYAADFVNSFGVLWERDAAAARFLREVYLEEVPHLEQLISLRQKMADFQDQRYEPKHRELWQSFLDQEKALQESWQHEENSR